MPKKPVPEIKHVADVYKELLEILENRIADFRIAVILGSILNKDEGIMEHARSVGVANILKNPERQLAYYQEAHTTLNELLMEQRVHELTNMTKGI